MRSFTSTSAVVASVVAAVCAVIVDVPAAAGLPPAAGYRMVDLGTLGGASSYATAVNDRGEVVGASAVADGSFHGFLWRDGTMVDLGAFTPVDINNRGQIAGYMDTGDLYWHSFLWTRGELRDIGVPGLMWSMPVALNDRGQVVGAAYTDQGDRMFLWSRGRMRPLPLASVSGINNHGRVAGGAVYGTDGFHASTWRRGTVTDLGAPMFDRSNSYAINNRGVVVGWGFSADMHERGLVWRKGSVTDIGTLGGDWTQAKAINDRGQVLAVSATSGGESHPALWHRGTLVDLTEHGVAAGATVADIDNNGAIAATVRVEPGASHAVLYRRR